MLEREESKSPIKPKKLKDMEEELNKTGESEDTRRLGAISARQDGASIIPRQYNITVSEKDVKHSSIYKAGDWRPKKKESLIRGELDIKNQVLADKRRTLMQILKEKRTDDQILEAYELADRTSTEQESEKNAGLESKYNSKAQSNSDYVKGILKTNPDKTPKAVDLHSKYRSVNRATRQRN